MTIETHFELRPLRHVAQVKNSNVDKISKTGEARVRLCNYVDVYRNDLIVESMNFMRATATDAEIVTFRLRVGDVLLTKDSELWSDIGVPAFVAQEADDLVCGYHLTMLRPYPSEILGSFLARALRVPSIANQLHTSAKGVTRYGLSIGSIKAALVPVPDLEEQEIIVRYLDHAELRIARAITAKEELIRLLEEQRFSFVVSEVLGRQCDDLQAKSGSALSEDRVLDWVGPTPADWSIKQLIEVAQPVLTKNHGLSVERVLSLSYGRVVVKPEANLHGLVPKNFENYQIVQAGDIIIRPMDLQNDKTSLRVGAVETQGIITSAYIALRPNGSVNSRFLMLQLAAYDFMKVFYGYGSGLRQNLDFRHIKHIPMAFPALDEQDEIVRRVDLRTASLIAACDALMEEIALLKEYRTRLISDVVTGKLDVRAEAEKLDDIDPAELAAALSGGSAETELGEEEVDADD